MRWLRRLLVLGLLGGAGAAAFRILQQRQVDAAVPAAPPDWPRMNAPATTFQPVATATKPTAPDESPATTGTTRAAAVAETDDHENAAVRATWLAPVDGACPTGYPIKANDNSGIFHVPGGRFYDRTVPERCYADSADAERDGYRQAKA
jgi:hypothetical protein